MVKVSAQIPLTKRRVEVNTGRLLNLYSTYLKKYPLLTKTTTFAIAALSLTGAAVATRKYLHYRSSQESLKRELELASKREKARLAQIRAEESSRLEAASAIAARSAAKRVFTDPNGSVRKRAHSASDLKALSARLSKADVPVGELRRTFTDATTPLTGALIADPDGSATDEDLSSIARRLTDVYGVDAPEHKGVKGALSPVLLATQRGDVDRAALTQSMRETLVEGVRPGSTTGSTNRDTSPARRGGIKAVALTAKKGEARGEVCSNPAKIAAIAFLLIGAIAAVMRGASTIALPKVEPIPMNGAMVRYDMPGRGTLVEGYYGSDDSFFSAPLYPTEEGPTDPLIREMLEESYEASALEGGETSSGVRVLPAVIAEKYGDSIANLSSAPVDERQIFTVEVPSTDKLTESKELARVPESASPSIDGENQQGSIVDGLVMCAAEDALKRFGLRPAAGFTEEGRARFISPSGEHFELSSLAGCDLKMFASKEDGLKGGALSCPRESFKKVTDLTLWRESLSDHSRLGVIWECVKHPFLCINALTASGTHEDYTGPLPAMNVTQKDMAFIRAPGLSGVYPQGVDGVVISEGVASSPVRIGMASS